MAVVAQLEGRLAIDGIRSAQGDLRAFDSAMRDSARSADKAADGVEKAGSRMGSALSGLAKAAAVAGVAVGAGLGAALGGAIKVAADFQQSLANVGSATGATGDQMKAMRQEALKIGADTSKSASEAVAAMGELVKAGMSVETVIGGAARATVQLAEATGIDMVEAATLTSNAMNTFKSEGLDAATAASIFAKAANASAIDVSDLGQSLSAVGAVWSTSGQNMQDFATAVGILGNNAIRGSDAGTSLKAMLAGLTPNSKEAAAAMQQLGINAFNADGSFKSFRDIVGNLQQAFGPLNEQQRATFGELIFGSDAVRSLNVLLKEGVSGWDAFQESMAQAPSLADQSAQRMNTLNGQIEMLKGSLETIAIEVGSLFLPALTQLAGFLAQNIGPAFDALRTRLAGLWANVGPEATAAGAAIVTGLTSASTWITSTFLPAVQRVAGDIWAEVAPKAQAAARDMIDALGSVKSWVESNWPAVREALGGIFDRLAETAGPAIEEVKRRLAELEQRMEETDQKQRELFRDGSAFDRLAEYIASVDFSPLVSAFDPVIAAGRRWVDFVNQDFSATGANLADAVREGKAQLDSMTPGWVNLENAAKVAGGIVVGVASSMASAVATAMDGVRNALQIVVDISNDDLPAAFRSAGSAALNFASVLPIVGSAVNILRAAVELIGGAFSSAAGAASSLAGGISAVGSAAVGALGPLRGALDLIGRIGSALPGLGDIMKHSPVPLAEGVKESSAAIARLNVELARLNQQLKFAEPMSDHAAAIQHDIDILEAWRGQLQASTALLKAEADALEASKTALDGATESRSKFLQQQSDIARFGTGGADVMGGLLTALTEGTAQSGRDAYAGLEKFIDGLKDTLGPRAQEAGNYLRFLFFETLSATGEDREAALARFGQFFTDLGTQQQAQMTVSAQTMNSALTAALFDEAMVASLGEKGAAVRQAIAHALDVSGTPEAQTAMANTAKLIASFESEIRKLPASVQGPILAEYQAAMQAFANAPDDAGVAEHLTKVVSEADKALQFLPKNLDKLVPEMRAAALRLFDQVKAGVISVEDAQERFSQAISLIPQDLAHIEPSIRAEILNIAANFDILGLSAEQAEERIKGAMARAAAATAETARRLAATVATLKGGVFSSGPAAGGGGGNPYATLESMMNDENAGEVMAAIANAYHTQGTVYIQGLGWVKPVQETDGSITYEATRRPFDKGGVAYSEVDATLHGSRSNPEIVAPLSKLPEVLAPIWGGDGGYMSAYDDGWIRPLIDEIRKLGVAQAQMRVELDGRMVGQAITPYVSSYMTANVRSMGGGG